MQLKTIYSILVTLRAVIFKNENITNSLGSDGIMSIVKIAL